MDYTEFVDTIHNYTNRDSSVLPNRLIKVFVDLACDNIYKDVRVAPLEFTYTYDAIVADGDDLPVPGDASSFIQIRKLKADGSVDHVYNAKSDIRSFYVEDMATLNEYTFTREGANFKLYPATKAGDVYQIYYYRRLPSVYARFAVNEQNFTLGLLYQGATQQEVLDAVTAAENDPSLTETPLTADPQLQSYIVEEDGTGALDAGFYLGQLAPNWLRDENRAMLLYGTLREAYIYLQDEERAMAYEQLMTNAINELNNEDKRSRASGGVVTTHYSGGGLL